MSQFGEIPVDTLSYFGIKPGENWASFTLVRVIKDVPKNLPPEQLREWFSAQSPVGYVLVKNEEEFGESAKWKGPGGGKDAGDATPRDTAKREVEEEAGIVAGLHSFEYVSKYRNRKARGKVLWDCLFALTVTRSEQRRMNNDHPKNEGEVPRYFTPLTLHREVAKDGVLKNHWDSFVNEKLVPANNDQTPQKAA